MKNINIIIISIAFSLLLFSVILYLIYAQIEKKISEPIDLNLNIK